MVPRSLAELRFELLHFVVIYQLVHVHNDLERIVILEYLMVDNMSLALHLVFMENFDFVQNSMDVRFKHN